MVESLPLSPMCHFLLNLRDGTIGTVMLSLNQKPKPETVYLFFWISFSLIRKYKGYKPIPVSFISIIIIASILFLSVPPCGEKQWIFQ